jgi:lysyl-tRNA synthetase class 2
MDRTHNPIYRHGNICSLQDWMMKFEDLLEHCAIAVNGTSEATFGAHKINFKAPYARVTMTDSIKHFTDFDISGKSEIELLMPLEQ